MPAWDSPPADLDAYVARAMQTWTPQTVIPIRPVPAEVAQIQPDIEDSGLGFFVQDYRGHKIITHSGAILGGLSAMVIVPEKKALEGLHGCSEFFARRTVPADCSLRSRSLAPTGFLRGGIQRSVVYGTASISSSGGGLRIRFDATPGMEGTLEHVQYDTFRTHWTDRDFEDAYVSFALDFKVAIDSLAMRAVSPSADFSFEYQDLHFTPARPQGPHDH